MKRIMQYKGHKLEGGLWYDPYTRIFSIGGSNRIAEISNYPRVYEDTEPHVYTKDTAFIVTEDDLDMELEDGERVYWNSREKRAYRIGEQAIHHEGEPLPGNFPKWLEYDAPQEVTLDRFPLAHTPKPIDLKAASVLEGESLTDLPEEIVEKLKFEIVNDSFVLPGMHTRQIIYFHYQRRFQ